MNLTFTGVDEKTNIKKLNDISAQYPLVEWGILYSRKSSDDENEPRYVPLKRIEELVHEIEGKRKALHLCGAVVPALLRGEKTEVDDFLYATSGLRIQLNVAFEAENYRQVTDLMLRYPETIFITQYNSRTNEAHEEIFSKQSLGNHHVLYDASGGKGISPDEIPVPAEGKICGFAGGIGNDNIEKVLKQTEGVYHWLDMETKVRTAKNLFDLNKCKKIAVKVFGEENVV